MSKTEVRAELLDAVIDHLAAHGTAEQSLRTIAGAIGTSHRMLIYHFGSKEGLFTEVVRVVEARQQQAFAALRGGPGARPAEVMRRMWRQVSDPALWPLARLAFELQGRALHGSQPATPLAVDPWLEPLANLAKTAGIPEEVAHDEARLWVAGARGLLLDLLSTRDRAAVDRAAERFIAKYETQASRPPHRVSRR